MVFILQLFSITFPSSLILSVLRALLLMVDYLLSSAFVPTLLFFSAPPFSVKIFSTLSFYSHFIVPQNYLFFIAEAFSIYGIQLHFQ